MHQVAVINGKSWPHTERLTYSADQPVRWRWINASDVPHPMHMHGSYFRIDRTADEENSLVFGAGEQLRVNTYTLAPGYIHGHFLDTAAGSLVVSLPLHTSYGGGDDGRQRSRGWI